MCQLCRVTSEMDHFRSQNQPPPSGLQWHQMGFSIIWWWMVASSSPSWSILLYHLPLKQRCQQNHNIEDTAVKCQWLMTRALFLANSPVVIDIQIPAMPSWQAMPNIDVFYKTHRRFKETYQSHNFITSCGVRVCNFISYILKRIWWGIVVYFLYKF